MKENFDKVILNDARRLIGHKREQMEEEARMWKDFQQLTNAVEEFRRENEDLQQENTQLQNQLTEERSARAAVIAPMQCLLAMCCDIGTEVVFIGRLVV